MAAPCCATMPSLQATFLSPGHPAPAGTETKLSDGRGGHPAPKTGIIPRLLFLTFLQASHGGSSGHFCTGECVISSRRLGTFSGVEDLALPLCPVNFHVGFIWCDSTIAGVVPLPLHLLPNCFCICTARDTRPESATLGEFGAWNLVRSLSRFRL